MASLGFALSPLIIIWSRTAVSDALLTGTLGISLLLFWRRMASKNNDLCISAWVFLGFAILTKGPVALVLAILTVTSFLFTQKDWRILLCKISPKRGFLITILISVPWYVLELIKEGQSVKLKQGQAVFFASFIRHRVAPVTKGVRRSLVMWFGGTPFK